MKKLKLFFSVLMLLFVGFGQMWGADPVSTLTFTTACGGSGTADDGAAWTVTSDGAESTFDSNSGIHYGTNSKSVQYVQLATSGVSGTITQVVVNARDAQAKATVSVTVGGTAFTCSGSATASNSSADYTFTGSASGEIVVRVDRGSSMTKAIYVKSVAVTHSAGGNEPGGGDEPGGDSGEEAGDGTIIFGSASGSTNVNAASVTGDDSRGKTWTVTTAGTTSFTPNSGYAQIGSSSKPASSITFTTTLDEAMTITAFSAQFGGFSGTAGTVTLKVGDTSVGTGSLNGTTDVTVNASNTTTSGTVLTVTVTGISKGVKVYNISYTVAASGGSGGDTPEPTLFFDTSSIPFNFLICTVKLL